MIKNKLNGDDLETFRQLPSWASFSGSYQIPGLNGTSATQSTWEPVDTKPSTPYVNTRAIVESYLGRNIDFNRPEDIEVLTLCHNYLLNEKTPASDWQALDLSEQANLLSLMSQSIHNKNLKIEFNKKVFDGIGTGLNVLATGAVFVPCIGVKTAAGLGMAGIAANQISGIMETNPGISKDILETYFNIELFTSEYMDMTAVHLDESGKEYVINCHKDQIEKLVRVSIPSKVDDDNKSKSSEELAELQQERAKFEKLQISFNGSMEKLKRGKEELVSEGKKPDQTASTPLLPADIAKQAAALAECIYVFVNQQHEEGKRKEAAKQIEYQLKNNQKLKTLEIRLSDYEASRASLPTIQADIELQLLAFAFLNQELLMQNIAMRLTIMQARAERLEYHSTRMAQNIQSVQNEQRKLAQKMRNIRENKFFNFSSPALGLGSAFYMYNPAAFQYFAIASSVAAIFSSISKHADHKKTSKLNKKIETGNAKISQYSQQHHHYNMALVDNNQQLNGLREHEFAALKDLDPAAYRLKIDERQKEASKNLEEYKTREKEVGREKDINDRITLIKHQIWLKNHHFKDRMDKSFKDRRIDSMEEEIQRLEQNLPDAIDLPDLIDREEKEIEALKATAELENNPEYKATRDWWHGRQKQLVAPGFDTMTEEEKQAKTAQLANHALMMEAYQKEVSLRIYKNQAWNGMFSSSTNVVDSMNLFVSDQNKWVLTGASRGIMVIEVLYNAHEAISLVQGHVLSKFKKQFDVSGEAISDFMSWYRTFTGNGEVAFTEVLNELLVPSINVVANIANAAALLCGLKVSDVSIIVSAINKSVDALKKELHQDFEQTFKKLDEIRCQIAELQKIVIEHANKLIKGNTQTYHQLTYLTNYTRAAVIESHQCAINQHRLDVNLQYANLMKLLPGFIRHVFINNESALSSLCELLIGLELAASSNYSGGIALKVPIGATDVVDVRYYTQAIAKNAEKSLGIKDKFAQTPNLPLFTGVLKLTPSLLNRIFGTKKNIQIYDQIESYLNNLLVNGSRLHDFVHYIGTNYNWIEQFSQRTLELYKEMYELLESERQAHITQLQINHGEKIISHHPNSSTVAKLSKDNLVGSLKFKFSHLMTTHFEINTPVEWELPDVVQVIAGTIVVPLVLPVLPYIIYRQMTNYIYSVLDLEFVSKDPLTPQNIITMYNKEMQVMNEDDISYSCLGMDMRDKFVKIRKYLAIQSPMTVSLVIDEYSHSKEESDGREYGGQMIVKYYTVKLQLEVNGKHVSDEDVSKIKFPYPKKIEVITDPAKQSVEIQSYNEKYMQELGNIIDQHNNACMNNRSSMVNSIDLSDSTLISPQAMYEGKYPKLHFPNKFLHSLRSDAQLKRHMRLCYISLGALFYRYKITNAILEEQLSCQLSLIFCSVDADMKEHELFEVVVAQFDATTVMAYKKVVMEKKGYHYEHNMPEFLITAMYGSAPNTGFIAKGTHSIHGHDAIFPVEQPFVGLYRVLEKIGSDHIFIYDHNHYSDEVSTNFLSWMATLDPRLSCFFRKRHPNEITYCKDYTYPLQTSEEIYAQFYKTRILNNELYADILNKLQENYQMLLLLSLMTGEVDTQSMIILLSRHLNIEHPYYLQRLAEINFEQFFSFMLDYKGYNPKDTPSLGKSSLVTFFRSNPNHLLEETSYNKSLIESWQRTFIQAKKQSEAAPQTLAAKRPEFRPWSSLYSNDGRLRQRLKDYTAEISPNGITARLVESNKPSDGFSLLGVDKFQFVRKLIDSCSSSSLRHHIAQDVFDSLASKSLSLPEDQEEWKTIRQLLNSYLINKNASIRFQLLKECSNTNVYIYFLTTLVGQELVTLSHSRMLMAYANEMKFNLSIWSKDENRENWLRIHLNPFTLHRNAQTIHVLSHGDSQYIQLSASDVAQKQGLDVQFYPEKKAMTDELLRNMNMRLYQMRPKTIPFRADSDKSEMELNR